MTRGGANKHNRPEYRKEGGKGWVKNYSVLLNPLAKHHHLDVLRVAQISFSVSLPTSFQRDVTIGFLLSVALGCTFFPSRRETDSLARSGLAKHLWGF